MSEHEAFRPGDEQTGSSAAAADPTFEPAGQRPAPRLLRFPDEGPGAGVAAGLGAYFGIDPVFFRIAFLLLAFAGGSGLLLYGIGWLVIPVAEPGQTAGQRAAPASDRTAQWVGIGLIVAAVFWLTGPFNAGGPVLWALALLAIGVILFREDANRRSREATAGTATDGLPPPRPSASAPGKPPVTEPPAGGTPVSGPPAGESSADGPSEDAEDADADEREAVLHEAARLREGELEGWSAGGWDPPAGGWDPPAGNWAPAPPPPAEPAPRRRSVLVRATLGLALVAVGVLALADNLSAAGAVAPSRYVALVLLVVGAGLLVGAWRGRARGLIPVGLLLLPLLAATALFPFGSPWHGGMGERTWQPAELDEVRPEYRLGMGQLSLDLSDVDFAGEEHTVSASVGLGQLDVVVPDDVDVTVNATAGAGELDLLGEIAQGNRLERTVDRTVTGAGSLTLELESGLGQVIVTHDAG